jgi:uncharacterized protein (TIGR02266 family)
MRTTSASGGPTDLQIKFDCPSLHDFAVLHAGDVSRGGIFIRTSERYAVGHTLKLDLTLSDGTPLIAGEGTVFWTRDPDPGRDDADAGMGVRFGKLTAASQRVLSYLLSERSERERADNPIPLATLALHPDAERTAPVTPAKGEDLDEERDQDDERTVVTTREALLAAAWPEKLRAAVRTVAVPEPRRAADPTPEREEEKAAAGEPMPEPEAAAPDAPAEGHAADAAPEPEAGVDPDAVLAGLAPSVEEDAGAVAPQVSLRPRRRLGLGVMVSGFMLLAVGTAMVPRAAARSRAFVAALVSPKPPKTGNVVVDPAPVAEKAKAFTRPPPSYRVVPIEPQPTGR